MFARRFKGAYHSIKKERACRIVPYARAIAILHSIFAQYKNYIATNQKRQATYFYKCLNKGRSGIGDGSFYVKKSTDGGQFLVWDWGRFFLREKIHGLGTDLGEKSNRQVWWAR